MGSRVTVCQLVIVCINMELIQTRIVWLLFILPVGRLVPSLLGETLSVEHHFEA
jgi:hypothetical protein